MLLSDELRSAVNLDIPAIMLPRLRLAKVSVRCALIGHKVHFTSIGSDAHARCVRCGGSILDQDNHSISHIAHTLSCFFSKHHYAPIATRHGHNEYVCEKCGHSLLFELARDKYPGNNSFEKRVSYGCGILGHRVHVVATGSNADEYACQCGHPFIKTQEALRVIRHPLACILLGHFITFNKTHRAWAEYVCRCCGHPFYFKLSGFNPSESVPADAVHD
jgi:DNA-directed RNA polymerase subunit RPC12/RpoP